MIGRCGALQVAGGVRIGVPQSAAAAGASSAAPALPSQHAPGRALSAGALGRQRRGHPEDQRPGERAGAPPRSDSTDRPEPGTHSW